MPYVPASSRLVRPQLLTRARVPATSPFANKWRRLYNCRPRSPLNGFLGAPLAVPCPNAGRVDVNGPAAEATSPAEMVWRKRRRLVMPGMLPDADTDAASDDQGSTCRGSPPCKTYCVLAFRRGTAVRRAKLTGF